MKQDYAKIFEELKKKYTLEEIAESYIFPATSDEKERAAILEEFKKIRKKLSDSMTPRDKTISRLLQLRFIIEDYIKINAYNKEYYFGYFLKEYIIRIEKNNKEFAEEIDVNSTELSQIINRHRKPTDKIIYRLEIHSNRNFPAIMWFKVLEKERSYELLTNTSIINKEKKHVKKRLEFSF